MVKRHFGFIFATAKLSNKNLKFTMAIIITDECINCGACEPECPVEAIFEEDAVPDEWKDYIKKNYDYFGRDYDE